MLQLDYTRRIVVKNKIKQLRLQNKMTQKNLADLVFVSTRTIISVENEQYNPSIILAYKIATVFNTTIEDLYYLKENINEYEGKR